MALAQQASVSSSRLEALRARHSALEAEIHEMSLHPSTSDLEMRKLKRLKLKVKEQLNS
ncbi:MAG: DUF465 domain-containing protein [Pseudobdellovibrionaceae bacterium]